MAIQDSTDMGATIHTLESFTTIVQPIGQTQERLQRMPTMAKMWETLIEVNKKVRELTRTWLMKRKNA